HQRTGTETALISVDALEICRRRRQLRAIGLRRREAIDRRRSKVLAQTERGRWEVRVVWRIGKMLRLEGDAGVPRVGSASLPGWSAVDPVARIELESGLRGVDVEGAAASRIDETGGERRHDWFAFSEDEVVVVAAGDAKLVVRHANPRANALRRREIERRACDTAYCASRNERLIDRRHLAGGDRQLVVENLART